MRYISRRLVEETVYPASKYGFEPEDDLPDDVWLHGSSKSKGMIPNFGRLDYSRMGSVIEGRFATKSWQIAINYTKGRGEVFLVRLDMKRFLDMSRKKDRDTLRDVICLDEDGDETGEFDLEEVEDDLRTHDLNIDYGFLKSLYGDRFTEGFFEQWAGIIDATDDRNVEIWDEDAILPITERILRQIR